MRGGGGAGRGPPCGGVRESWWRARRAFGCFGTGGEVFPNSLPGFSPRASRPPRVKFFSLEVALVCGFLDRQSPPSQRETGRRRSPGLLWLAPEQPRSLEVPMSSQGANVLEANHLYWDTEESVASIADQLDLSRRALYEALQPLAAGVSCSTCGAELTFENRSARKLGTAACSACGARWSVQGSRRRRRGRRSRSSPGRRG